MTKITLKKAKNVYGICVSVLTVVVGVLFISQACGIYFSGDKAYTFEKIGERFANIAIPFWIWVAAVIVGGVWSVICPDEVQPLTAYVDVKNTLEKLSRRLPEYGRSEAECRKQRYIRLALTIGCIIVCICAAVVALVLLFDKTKAVGLVKNETASKLIAGFPWIFGALCICAGAAIYQAYSQKKEITLIKAKIADNARKGVKLENNPKKKTLWEKWTEKMPVLQSEKFLWGVRAGLCVLAIVLIIWGICNGGMAAMLRKAVVICTQCIGLG